MGAGCQPSEGDIKDVTGPKVNFPTIGDPERKVAVLYDMIHPNARENFTVRSVFVIGPDNKVKLTITYPASPGRTSRSSPGSSIRTSSPPITRWRRR